MTAFLALIPVNRFAGFSAPPPDIDVPSPGCTSCRNLRKEAAVDRAFAAIDRDDAAAERAEAEIDRKQARDDRRAATVLFWVALCGVLFCAAVLAMREG